jgi:hypothetical protein
MEEINSSHPDKSSQLTMRTLISSNFNLYHKLNIGTKTSKANLGCVFILKPELLEFTSVKLNHFATLSLDKMAKQCGTIKQSCIHWPLKRITGKT